MADFWQKKLGTPDSWIPPWGFAFEAWESYNIVVC
jgi:hypothetical protein